MLRSFKLKALIALIFFVSLGSSQKRNRFYAKPTLAIMNFDSSGISEDVYNILYNKLWNDIDSIGAFIMVEQHQVYDVLEKYNYDRPECATRACAIEMGRLVGVKNVITGSFVTSGDSSSVQAELIMVREDSTKFSSTGQHVGEIDGLIPHIQIAALQLSGEKPSDALLIKAGLLTANVEENKLIKFLKSWFNKAKSFIFRKKVEKAEEVE
jgi:hypothetical protein